MTSPSLYDPFPLRVEHGNKILLGRLAPWKLPRDSIIPTRFMVYINDVFRGNIIFNDNQWREFEAKIEDQELVDAIGEYIAVWYE